MIQAKLQPWSLWVGKFLLWAVLLGPLLTRPQTAAMSGMGGCFEGQDVFTTVRENSLMGHLVAELSTETDLLDNVQWSLTGKDASWFFLDGRDLRLNTSERALDREVHGQVLIAALACYEDFIFQNEYRIMVEILNENDNSPVFVDSTIQPVSVNELTAVDMVVLTVRAEDADGDTIIYSIDQDSPDAKHFKVGLPNSGDVVLARSLDYETKTQLHITVYATEMNTPEHLSASASLTIDVIDGDDQYPQFLPCTLLFQDQGNRVCANPVYTANITEGEQDLLLDVSPGPIYAVDGDRALCTPLKYTILSGDENGRFLMDEVTGEVRLTQPVEDRLRTPTLRLQIVAYQVDDPRKYSVALVLVRVLAVNLFSPQFDQEEYRGFITGSDRPASLVNTYGNTVLTLRVQDRDFADGINPRMHFSLKPTSHHTQFYQITQEGLLIARTNELRPSQEYSLEVVAVDRETGDTVQAFIKVEVLYEGQEVPGGPLRKPEPISGCVVGKALALCGLFMSVLGAVLWALLHLLRRGVMEPDDRSFVAQGKHPNVSLRWFQVVNQRGPIPVWDEVAVCNEVAPPPDLPPPSKLNLSPPDVRQGLVDTHQWSVQPGDLLDPCLSPLEALQGPVQPSILPDPNLHILDALQGPVQPNGPAEPNLNILDVLQGAVQPSTLPDSSLSTSDTLQGPVQPNSPADPNVSIVHSLQGPVQPNSPADPNLSIVHSLQGPVQPNTLPDTSLSIPDALQGPVQLTSLADACLSPPDYLQGPVQPNNPPNLSFSQGQVPSDLPTEQDHGTCPSPPPGFLSPRRASIPPSPPGPGPTSTPPPTRGKVNLAFESDELLAGASHPTPPPPVTWHVTSPSPCDTPPRVDTPPWVDAPPPDPEQELTPGEREGEGEREEEREEEEGEREEAGEEGNEAVSWGEQILNTLWRRQ